MDDVTTDGALLRTLEARMDANRRAAGALRFPLLAVAVATVASAGWCLLAGRRMLVVFYLPALLLAMVASAVHLRRLARRTGVLLPLGRWAGAAVALVAACATTSRLGVATGNRLLEEAGPTLVMLAGYHLLGRWGQNRLLMTTTALLMPLTLLGATILAGDTLVATELAATGALLAVAGAGNRETPA